MRALTKISAALALIFCLVGLFAVQAAGEVLTVTLDAAEYQIETDEKGLQRIRMENFVYNKTKCIQC